MTAVASLGMYDLPEIQAANDALWRGLARHLAAAGLAGVPAGLTRSRPLSELWRDPDLVLGQTCGYPLVTALAGRVRVVATPCYRAPGCDGPQHRSLVVVPAASAAVGLADLRGGVVAVNAADSNTGMNLLRAAIAPLAGGRRFFRAVRLTGGHVDSLAAVAAGEAAAAAIDAVTFALLARHRPAAIRGVRILASTAASPGLPLITALAGPVAALRGALAAVAADPALADCRAALLLDGFSILPETAYDPVASLERQAATLGYPELC